MGLLDKILGKKEKAKTETVMMAGTPQELKEKLKVDTPNVDVEAVCRYYVDGQCNAGGQINPCSFNNPQNCENCPVWRFNALGDISAIL